MTLDELKQRMQWRRDKLRAELAELNLELNMHGINMTEEMIESGNRASCQLNCAIDSMKKNIEAAEKIA